MPTSVRPLPFQSSIARFSIDHGSFPFPFVHSSVCIHYCSRRGSEISTRKCTGASANVSRPGAPHKSSLGPRKSALPPSFTQSLARSLARSLTHSLTHSNARGLCNAHTYARVCVSKSIRAGRSRSATMRSARRGAITSQCSPRCPRASPKRRAAGKGPYRTVQRHAAWYRRWTQTVEA